MKRCSKCGVEKPLEAFSKGRSPDGCYPWCKTCDALRYQERKASRTPEDIAARKQYERDYRARNKEQLAARHREWRAENAADQKEKRHGYYVTHAAEISAKKKKDRKDNPEKYNNPASRAKHTAKRRLREAGFTPSLYEDTFRQQDYLCAVCGIDLRGLSTHTVHADHDHATGFPRGILCGSCNTGLGMFKDSTALLFAAVAYLRNPTLRQVPDLDETA